MLWWLVGLWLLSPALLPVFWLVDRLMRAIERASFFTENHTMIGRPKPWPDWLVVLSCAAMLLAITTVPS
jgi:hypothetical protein